MSHPPSHIGLILAAGGSTRMGSAKQLLSWQGKSLIEHTCSTALTSSRLDKIYVCLGNQAELIASPISSLPLTMIEHKNWQKGMGYSIRYAVSSILMQHPAVRSLTLMTCDTPLLNASHLDRLVRFFDQSQNFFAAVSYYANTWGIPATFSRKAFHDLLSLSGDKGAKPSILRHLNEILAIPFDGAAIDIDTPSDYVDLSRASRSSLANK